MERVGARMVLDKGQVLGRVKTIAERRMTLMKDFFEEAVIEVRVTAGKDWDQILLRSVPEHCNFLKTLTDGYEYTRHSEVHKSMNIFLYGEALERFQLRITVGLQLDQELGGAAQKEVEPKLNALTPNVFIYRHVFTRQLPPQKNAPPELVYEEPIMSRGYCPKPLPTKWYAIAKKGIIANKTVQYDDPTIEKKVRRTFKGGSVFHYVDLREKRTEQVLHSVPFGPNEPTRYDLWKMQLPSTYIPLLDEGT